MKMTKAMYNISKTYSGMIKLHKKEVKNHQRLIDEFNDRANKTKDEQERMICMLEASRNREHQKGHKIMITFYTYLDDAR